ncbi:redoxin domain-containing protein [Candidatus Woesearchaeota archaeon]|nr:redoxin domain-containing protein [Candidatus Woesearchaeota archaeon]
MKKETIYLIIALIAVVGVIGYIQSISSERGYKDLIDQPAQIGSDRQIINPEKEGKYPKAPELRGIAGYLNVEDITIAQQQGKVVLIDFWTYSCINCIRTLPHLTEWDRKYREKGFVIIGVHTPEFNFEKEYDNVQAAMEKYNIEYSVVQDNDYLTWRAYQNRYWPRKYLIDHEGYIRYDHIGEGAYDETEKMIQQLLEEAGQEADEELSEIEDKTPILRRTPELYAGHQFALPRGQNVGNEEGLQPEQIIDYTLPEAIKDDIIYLEGRWRSGGDELAAKSNGLVVLDYIASDVNIVADGSQEIEVFLDDRYITEEQAGADVQFDNMRAYIVVDEPRLYNVISGDYGRDILKLKVNEGFSFNAFTFG